MSLELNPEIYRAVLENLPIGVYLVDRKRQIVFWNRSAERITGFLGQEVIGRHCPDNLLEHCDENYTCLCREGCPLRETMRDGNPRDLDLSLRHKDGQRVPVRVRSAPLRDEFGTIIGSAEFFEERSHNTVEMRGHGFTREASIDRITETADQHSMQVCLQAALEEYNTSQEFFGVLCIAAGNLDQVRQVYGCHAVQAVLHAAAQTLSRATRPGDVVGRWDAEHLAALVICPTREDLLSCARRLQRLTSMASVPWWGDRLAVSISIGGTIVREGDTVGSLMQRAADTLETVAGTPDNSPLVI